MVGLLYTLLAPAALIPSTRGCAHEFDYANETESYPNYISGSDGPADTATSGFVFNHFSLLEHVLSSSQNIFLQAVTSNRIQEKF
ncbi:hypothetical protein VTL71DRAFT_13439 [Oculimacula yallundae]|uniref:Uncharacterized protein n=1 Tax=Oculimacula yallundae TaxID=86028 RepID=A0ABR4CKD1_9HELO